MGVKAHVVRTNLAFAQDKPPTKIKISERKRWKRNIFKTDEYRIESKHPDIEHIIASLQRHSNVIVNSQVHNILLVDAIFDFGLNS